MKLLAQPDEHLGNLNLDRARRLAGPAQARSVRQMMIRAQTVIKRSEHGADGPGINAAISMSADAAINGTRIEARTAANAKQTLAQGTAQNSRASIVENDEMKFLRAVELAGFARPRNELRID